VAGRRPVAEAFAAHRPAKRLLVVPERRDALEQLVLHATSLRIPVVEVEGGTLTAVSGFDGHQGVALVVEPRRWASLDDVLARARERGEAPFVLVLDSLEDPQNVGTLLRTADACGVHGVLFPTRRAAPISPAAVKASAGAVEHLLLVPLDDLGGGLVDLHSRGLRIVGADEKAALSYRDADLRGPLALAVGSEGHGISGGIRRRLDLAVRIPMHGQVASLNVAVAGSVLLFEAAAQRPHGERAVSPEREQRSQAAEPSGADAAPVEHSALEPVVAEPEADTPKPRGGADLEPVTAEPEADSPKPRRRAVPKLVVPEPGSEAAEPEADTPKRRRGRVASERVAAEPEEAAPKPEEAAPKPRRRRAAARTMPEDATSQPPATDAGAPPPGRAARSLSKARTAAPQGRRSRAKPAGEGEGPDDLLPGELEKSPPT
jgi:23S rRNA (guanosine2251-2'-O)-methyltransferase